MSIAFPALVITILILPGILFFYTYRRGIGPSPIILQSVQSEIVYGILFSIPIMLVMVGLINWLPFPDVDYDAVIALLTNWHGADDTDIEKNIRALSQNAGLILFFVVITNACSIVSGYLLHAFVRYYRLDLRIDLLRFSNEWSYLFSGQDYAMNVLREEKEKEALRQRMETYDEDPLAGALARRRIKVRRWQIPAAEIKAKEQEIDLHVAAVTIQQGNEVYIYRGVLDQYFFDKKGELKKIVIMYPQRRNIKDDHQTVIIDGKEVQTEGFYDIDGHYFVIEYDRVLNLNLYFYKYSAEMEFED